MEMLFGTEEQKLLFWFCCEALAECSSEPDKGQYFTHVHLPIVNLLLFPVTTGLCVESVFPPCLWGFSSGGASGFPPIKMDTG